jgi:DNA polymerase-3 subunit alpha
VTVEDLQGTAEIIVFPDLYRAASELLVPERVVRITGTVDRGEKGTKIRGVKVELLAELQAKTISKVNIKVTDTPEAGLRLSRLQEVLQRHPGSTLVYLTFRVGSDYEADTAPLPTIKVTPSEYFVADVEEVLGKGVVGLVT